MPHLVVKAAQHKEPITAVVWFITQAAQTPHPHHAMYMLYGNALIRDTGYFQKKLKVHLNKMINKYKKAE